MTEQAATTQNAHPPSSEDPQNASPLPSQDEGYGHGITLDSMIVTPRVPTLVEESTNIGTEGECETSEEIAVEFVANSSTSEKAAFMKQAAVTLIYVANAIEKESEAHTETKKLAEERLEKIKYLESQLKEEKMIST